MKNFVVDSILFLQKWVNFTFSFLALFCKKTVLTNNSL